TSVVVNNVVPSNVILTANPGTINENSSTTLSGSFSDPGTQDTHTVVIGWGDGSPSTTVTLAAGVLTFSGQTHQYLDNRPANAPYTISATVTDKDNASGVGSTSVTVNNVAPTVSSPTVSATTLINPGTPVTVSGTFTDPAAQLDQVYTGAVN